MVKRYKNGTYWYGRKQLTSKELELILFGNPAADVVCLHTGRCITAWVAVRLGIYDEKFYIGYPSKDWKRIYDRQTKNQVSIAVFEQRAEAANKKAVYFDKRLKYQIQKPVSKA